MDGIHAHPLAKANPENIVIISNDTLLSHCCGAIIKKFFNHLDKDASKITFIYTATEDISASENLTHVFRIGCTAQALSSTYMKNVNAHVVDVYNRCQVESMGIKKADVTINNSDFRMCGALWKYLFDNTSFREIPACINHLDDYASSAVCSDKSAYFYMGMLLMETRADSSYDFWEALFDSRENLPSTATESEIMERMKWDTMLQVTNMGAVIETYHAIETEEACKNALVHERIPYLNVRNYVPRVLFQNLPDADFIITFYAVQDSNVEQGYALHYTVLTQKENASAKVFAEKFGGAGTRTKATFTSTLTPNQIGEQLSCKQI